MISKKAHNVAVAWFGVIAAAVFTISWISASALDLAWVFGQDMISDLGVADGSKDYFNYGCILTGIFAALFGFGNAIYSNNKLMAAGGIIFIICAAFLILIGLVPEDAGAKHDYIANIFVLFALISIILMSAGAWADGHEFIAGITLVILCTLIGVYISSDLAMLEGWAVIGALFWIVIQSVECMIRKPCQKSISKV